MILILFYNHMTRSTLRQTDSGLIYFRQFFLQENKLHVLKLLLCLLLSETPTSMGKIQLESSLHITHT